MNTGLKLYYALLILGILHQVNVTAQLPYLKHFTTKDGLPSSTIYGGTQDKDGFIWFGTDVGVTRFDGKNFANFTLAVGLSDNEILLVKQDSKGRIWFLGLNGTVSYYFNSVIYNSENDSILNEIKSVSSFVNIYEDKNNTIWFSTADEFFLLDTNYKVKKIGTKTNDQLGCDVVGGLVFDIPKGQFILSNCELKPFIIKYSKGEFSSIHKQDFLPTRSLGYYFEDGSILFLSKEGIVHQSDSIQKLIIPSPVDYQNDGSQLVGIEMTTKNKLWLSIYRKGIFVYNYANFKEKPVFLNINNPGSLVLDHEGNVWIGTLNEGIYMLPVWANQTKLITVSNGISENTVFSVSKLKNNEILIGQSNGLIYTLSENKSANSLNISLRKNHNRVVNILCDRDDVWIARNEGVLHYNKKKGCNHFLKSSENAFSPISNAKDISILSDKLFITTHRQIYTYDLPCPGEGKQLCEKFNSGTYRYYSVHASENRAIWYSNLNGLFSVQNDSITSHEKNHELFSKRMNDILELPDSTIVLASYGYGLIFYKNGKIIKHLKKSDGLISDICRKLFIYNNIVYVATPEGVSIVQYDKENIQIIKNFNTTNALPTNDVNDVYADEEEILIATSNGLVILKQKDITEKDKGVPLLRLLSISMENQALDKDSSYNFNYTLNSFQFKYIGIYYQSPDEVVYRYRLNDNESWQLTQNTSIDLLSLSDGKYSFQLQAKVKEGSWSPVEKFNFTISPPFWKTNWFIAGFFY